MLRRIGLLSSCNLQKLAVFTQNQLPVASHLMRCSSKSSKKDASDKWDKPLGGYEYKDEVEPFRKLVTYDTYLELIGKTSGQNVRLSYEWLRENCRCSSCFNQVTNQRNTQLFDILPEIHPKWHSFAENHLNIEWSDGHQSDYAVDWLKTHSRQEVRPQEILWSGDIAKDVEHVTLSDVKSRDGVTRLVKSLLQYGVGFVTNVDPTLAGTEEAICCVGPPMQTLFSGGMWEFSDKMDHMDTAYTNQALDCHTDTTYFIEPAGLIIFHCVKRQCTGGETVLVDGFRAAAEVELESPALYQCLKSVHTEFQYIEKDHHLTSMSHMIHHTPDNKIKQIRYNLYDRSARLPFPSSETSLFYKSVRRLAAAVRRAEAQWSFTLEPGTVVFINNWRVLHGRCAYAGQRTIAGAYVSMGDLLSRARCLYLLT